MVRQIAYVALHSNNQVSNVIKAKGRNALLSPLVTVNAFVHIRRCTMRNALMHRYVSNVTCAPSKVPLPWGIAY